MCSFACLHGYYYYCVIINCIFTYIISIIIIFIIIIVLLLLLLLLNSIHTYYVIIHMRVLYMRMYICFCTHSIIGMCFFLFGHLLTQEEITEGGQRVGR